MNDPSKRTLSEKALVYWQVSFAFHQGGALTTEGALNALRNIRKWLSPERALYKRAEELNELIVTGRKRK